MHLLVGDSEGRVRIPVGGLPDGVIAVTVPVRRDRESHAPRDRRGRLRVADVDLIAEEPSSAYSPSADLSTRDLIFALEAGRRDWSTIVDYFGINRVHSAALSLVRSGGVVLRCQTDENLDLALPVGWRRSHAWSLQHADLLNDLRGRPDPDALRAELIQLMSSVPKLDEERALLDACPAGTPLRVPAKSATATAAWSVYENAIRAAVIWWPHHDKALPKLTAHDVAGRAFRNSKAWTPERAAAFTNLIGISFDQALDRADTDIRVRGPLEWWIGSVAADASTADPWIALPARGLQTVGDLRCRAGGVLLVENADTFEKVCTIPGLTEAWLCIWGKGYSSHGMVTLLEQFSTLPMVTSALVVYGVASG
ncbi:hypothetical protein ABH935_009169 [Catenulispora sp. GAS73]|uniref:hypothetical protein n=1 Tax=Catenulispora sp. GAS73 TaxID=3156269 RepID=UPI0035196596